MVLLHIRILFTQQSSDTTQFMCSMDTVTSDISHVDNAPLSTPKPFQFTASAELHSLPTVTSETSTNTMPVQDLSTKTLLMMNLAHLTIRVVSHWSNHFHIHLVYLVKLHVLQAQ